MLACYVRVSTVGQNQASQVREIKLWLKGQNITDFRWYVDKKTGDHLDRPAFQELQQDIFRGEVSGVVVWKLDRLSRSITDGLNVLASWCDAGLRVVSVTQALDFNGALGKMLAAIFFGIGEMETEVRRERQRAGIDAARERGGVYLGRKPGSFKAKPARAKQLRQQGLTIGEVAQAMAISRRTTQRYLAAT